jgi:hypothetical protein
MTSPIARARQLLALAADKSTTTEEARTSAVLAARIIAEHKLELVEGAPPSPAGFHPWDTRVDPRGWGSSRGSVHVDDFPRGSQPGAAQKPSSSPDGGGGPPPGYRPRRAARRHPPTTGLRQVILATHNGHCPHCGRPWRRGDPVGWAKGLRMTCPACKEKP